MGLTGYGEQWGVTDAEIADRYRCDDVLPDAPGRWFRGVDVHAPAPVVFAWLCQLKVAPYSYDLIDNFGRRSPRALLPGCQDLALGQSVMTVFTLVDFEQGSTITVRLGDGRGRDLFGDVVLTYRVVARDVSDSRLVAVLRVADGAGPGAALRRRLFAAGDLVMMRKQLRTLARLSESGETGAGAA